MKSLNLHIFMIVVSSYFHLFATKSLNDYSYHNAAANLERLEKTFSLLSTNKEVMKSLYSLHDIEEVVTICWNERIVLRFYPNGSSYGFLEYSISMELTPEVKTTNQKTETEFYEIYDNESKKSRILEFVTAKKDNQETVKVNQTLTCKSDKIYSESFTHLGNKKRVEIKLKPVLQDVQIASVSSADFDSPLIKNSELNENFTYETKTENQTTGELLEPEDITIEPDQSHEANKTEKESKGILDTIAEKVQEVVSSVDDALFEHTTLLSTETEATLRETDSNDASTFFNKSKTETSSAKSNTNSNLNKNSQINIGNHRVTSRKMGFIENTNFNNDRLNFPFDKEKTGCGGSNKFLLKVNVDMSDNVGNSKKIIKNIEIDPNQVQPHSPFNNFDEELVSLFRHYYKNLFNSYTQCKETKTIKSSKNPFLDSHQSLFNIDQNSFYYPLESQDYMFSPSDTSNNFDVDPVVPYYILPRKAPNEESPSLMQKLKTTLTKAISKIKGSNK